MGEGEEFGTSGEMDTGGIPPSPPDGRVEVEFPAETIPRISGAYAPRFETGEPTAWLDRKLAEAIGAAGGGDASISVRWDGSLTVRVLPEFAEIVRTVVAGIEAGALTAPDPKAKWLAALQGATTMTEVKVLLRQLAERVVWAE